MVLSTLFFAIMSTIVKYLSDFGSFQLVFFRSLGTLIFSTSFLIYRKIPFWGNQKKLLILRGLTGASSMILFFMALHFMTLGSAVTLRYTAPLFVALLSVLFLSEKIKFIQWVCFGISFLGVIMVKGFDATVDFFGLGIILFSSLTSAITYILISRIGTKDHYMVIINYFMLSATLIGALGSLFQWKNPQGLEWFYFLLLGVTGLIAQILMTKAFQIGPAYNIAPYKFVEVIFSLTFGVLIFMDVYTFFSLLGMGMIILGLILNGVFKRKNTV
jgi:drug/metabolite transporter (DMT)-like permease